MEKTEDEAVLRLRFGWLAKALWAIGGAAITFLALVLPRDYDAGATAKQQDDNVINLQIQVRELQEQSNRIQTEVEWLIRHSPNSQDAPLDEPMHGRSWMRPPNVSQSRAHRDSDVPSNFESVLGGLH